MSWSILTDTVGSFILFTFCLSRAVRRYCQKYGLRGSRGGLPLSGRQWASACLLSGTQPDLLTLSEKVLYRIPFFRADPLGWERCVRLRKGGGMEA